MFQLLAYVRMVCKTDAWSQWKRKEVAYRESNGHVTDHFDCLAIIITKNDNSIAAVQFVIKLFEFLLLVYTAY